MGMIRGALYEAVMSFLPDVDPRQPGNRARVLRAAELLSCLAPLVALLDGQADVRRGKFSVYAVGHFLASLLPAESVPRLKLKLASPADVAGLPTVMTDYRPLFNRLLQDELERLKASAMRKLGPEAMISLQNQLWVCLHGPLSSHLAAVYETFFAEAEVGLAANVIYSCLRLVTAFITAVIVNDEAALAWLMPMIAQLPMCLPVGALAEDPDRWIILNGC